MLNVIYYCRKKIYGIDLLYLILLSIASFFLVKVPIYSFPYLYFYSTEFILLILAYQYRTHYFSNLSLLLAVIFSGVRFDVGTDYLSYLLLFEDIYSNDALSLTEPFTYIIVNFVKNLGLGTEFIFFIYAIIPISGLHRLIMINDRFNSKLLSYFIFLTFPIYYLACFNQIRQWASIGISFYTLYYINKGDKFKFVTTLLIASSIHLSALLLFIYIFITKRLSFIFFSLSLFCSLLFSKILILLIEYTPYAIYIRDDGLRFEGGNYVALSIYLLISAFIVYKFNYFNKVINISLIKIILSNLNLLSISTILIGLLLKVDFLSMMRINAFFIINLILSLPMLIEDIHHNKTRRIFVYILLIFGFSYCSYTILVNGEVNKLTPYHFVFLPDRI